jgi:hypothetical protein
MAAQLQVIKEQLSEGKGNTPTRGCTITSHHDASDNTRARSSRRQETQSLHRRLGLGQRVCIRLGDFNLKFRCPLIKGSPRHEHTAFAHCQPDKHSCLGSLRPQ